METLSTSCNPPENRYSCHPESTYACQSTTYHWSWRKLRKEYTWQSHRARVGSQGPLSRSSTPTTLTILSLNRWFEGSPDTAPEDRMKALLNALANTKADIITLQEVNQNALRSFSRDRNFMKKWIVSSLSANVHGKENHGLLTLINLDSKFVDALSPSTRIHLDDHPDSKMRSHRGLLVSEILVRGASGGTTPVRIINGHLESVAPTYGDNSEAGIMKAKQLAADMRDYQISVASTIASAPSGEASVLRTIFAGDFNLEESFEQDGPQRHGFRDAYLDLGSADEGNTFGIHSYPNHAAKRIDRITYMGALQPQQFDIMFTDPISISPELRAIVQHDVFMSDHAGVQATFIL